MSNLKIAGLCTSTFLAAFLAGSLVSFLIEGVAYYRESAISGTIIAVLMAWQLHRNRKGEANG